MDGLSAIDDLAATIKMGRDVGRRGPYIASLVGFAIEHSVIGVAATYLPQQNAKTLNGLQPCVEPLPKGSRLGGAVQGEREYLLQYVRPQYENKSAKEALGLLKDELTSDEEAKAILKSV